MINELKAEIAKYKIKNNNSNYYAYNKEEES